MAKRILWEEPEALLLFDAYDLMQAHPEKRREIINAMSINLRRRAFDLQIPVDDVFRNPTGINMRLQEIEKILHPESIGLSNTSALFRSTAEMYSNHRRTFLRKVKALDEYRVKILPEGVGFDIYETVILLDGYLQLVNPGETRAHMSRLISAKLRSLAENRGCVVTEAFRSAGGINGRLNKMDQAFRGIENENSIVPRIFLDAVEIYRLDRKKYKGLLKTANTLVGKITLPEDLLKAEKEKKKRREAAPVIKTKYISTKKDRKLNDAYPKAYVAVFDALERSFYTEPKGVTATDIFVTLKKRYLRKVVLEILEGSSWAKERKQGKYVHVRGDEIMETQTNVAKKFFKWLKVKLPSKQVASIEKNYNSISMMLLKQKAIKKPLFLIDDADELNKLESKVPGCFVKASLRNDATQLVKYYIAYLNDENAQESMKQPVEKTATVPIVTKVCDASQTGFYNWLSQHELLSGPTCRSYVSGIRSSEAYAKEHSYVNYLLFSEDTNAAAKTVVALLEDADFLAQHGSYRAHLRKYLQYLGVGLPTIQTQSTAGVKTTKSPKQAADPKLVQAIEDTVKGYADGITATELEDRFSSYSDSDRRIAFQSADIIPVLDKYYHKDNIEDFDFLVDTLYDALCHQFNADGGYTSAHALYKEVAPKLDDFFFFNSAFESRAEIYDFAAYLFGKAGYKGANYIFFSKEHIWREEPDYAKNYGGLMIKYAREHGNVISRDDAITYITLHGSGTPAQTVSLILNKSGWQNFLQYAENQFVISEALNVDESFCTRLRNQIETLLEGEDYVALGDVSDYFYSTLPEVPAGVTWGPLLLESILERYEIGFITIDAGDSNDMKTIDAALLRKNSIYKTFADIVWNELKRDFQLPHTFSNEEFRLYLLGKGFLHGQEKIYTVHKTVANDLRFYWTDSNSKVTVSNS